MEQRTYHRRTAPRRRSLLSYEWVRILLFYILPFVVINLLIFFLVTCRPSYEIDLNGTDDYRTTDVTFTITSHMPLKTVTIRLDDEPLDLVKVGRKSYRSTVTHNGILEVHMENFNGVEVTGYEVIDILDNQLPDVVNYTMDNGILTLMLSDSQSGIDYEGLTAVKSDGQVIAPISIDKNTGIVTFEMDPAGLIVNVRDMSGNEYQPSFSVNYVEEGAEQSDTQLIIQ